jgi:sulfur-oxidizing protein SoxX
MRHTAKTIFTASSIAALLGSLAFSIPVIATAEEASVVKQGKQIAFNKKKGNCLACHDIKGGKLAGNIGPPLVYIKDRYTKAALKAQISNARSINPNTIMPPYGPHEIMSNDEIDKVVEFIHTL